MNIIKSFANQVMELRAKKVEIELDVNKALSVKESAEKDAELALQNVETIKKDVRELDNVLSNLTSNSSSIADSCKDISIEYLEAIRNAASIMNDYISSITQLHSKVEEVRKEIEQVQKDQESVWENIKNETIKLTVMKADLDVYKKRLERVRDVIAPKMQIII